MTPFSDVAGSGFSSSITSSTSPCPYPWEMRKAVLKRMSSSIVVLVVVMRTTS